jgi:hypothetical protein
MTSQNIRLGEAEHIQSRTALKASSQAYRPSVFADNDASSVPLSSASTALSKASQAFCPGFAAPTKANDAQLVQVVPASQYSPLYPAAKGAMQCFCRGEVLNVLDHYGWIFLYGTVNHPLASKRGGRIYISLDDVVPGKTLQVGDVVTFFLYADEMGLGAEVCDVEQPAAARFANQSPLHSESLQDWNQVQWQQTSPQPCYYVAVAVAPMPCTQQQSMVMPCASNADHEGVTTEPEMPSAEATGEDAGGKSEVPEGELPSVGSVGHFDGTCKRCAFFPKGRCRNGADCTHCHFEHAPRPRLKSQRKRNASPQTGSDQMGANDDNSEDQDGSVDQYIAGDSDADDVSQTGQESAPTKEEQRVTSTSRKVCEKSTDAEAEAETRSELNLLDLTKGVRPLTTAHGDVTDAETRTPSTSAPSDDDETRPMSTTSSSKSPMASSKRRSRNECGTESRKLSETSPREDACGHRKGSRLAPSPTSWSEQQRMRKLSTLGSMDGEQSSEDVARMARSLLNKLTKAKFESLCSQILVLPFSTPEQLSVVASELFEKATTQDGFRSLYVDLCMRLQAHLGQQSGAVSDKDFRKALANACQAIFDRSLQPQDAAMYDGLNEEERFELEVKVKTQRLGTMRFIGELLVRRLLAQKLMLPIIFQLLGGDEAALESLIALLNVVAPEFDQKSSPYQAPLNDAFSTLSRKSKDKNVSSRVRFQLRDLFEARARGWSSSAAP